jgi:mRNA interferase RelE/StbE
LLDSPSEVQTAVIACDLRERIAGSQDPRRFGHAPTGDLEGLWRYRVSDYRIVAAIEDDQFVVLMVTIGHRREVYR